MGTGVSQRGNTTSTKGILRTLFPSQHHRGDGGGDDPPEPDRRDTGKRKEGGSGGGGSGDDPNPDSGGSGGGGRPNPAGSGHTADTGALLDKMIGKEPEIFTGERDKVEEFMTSWSCNGSLSVESESRDFRPDLDRLVIVRCLALASCPQPFSLSYSLHSFPNQTTLLSSPSNDNYELRQQQLLSPLPSFPLFKTTPLHSFQHRLHQYPRLTSLEPDHEGWVIVDVLFVLGRGAPLVSYILHFSDRFYYILVHVVVTGSYVARHRHPDPRIPHCSYNLLSCALSVLHSIICQTTLP